MAVDPTIQEKADDIRMKIYGEQVRESLASGLEAMSSDVVEVEGRQDQVEEQFQQVIDETTGKDIVSAPEIIAARDGEDNLNDRLDKEKQEVAAQLAQKTEQSEFDAVSEQIETELNLRVKSVNDVLPAPTGNVDLFKVFNSIPTLEEFNQMSEGELGFIKESIIDVPYFNSYNSASDQTKELPLGNVRGPNSPYRAYVSFVPDESIAVKKITTRMVGQASDGIEHVAGDPVRVRVYANSAFTGLLGTATISNVTSESGVLFDGVAEFVTPVSMNGGTKYFFLYDIPNFTGENSYRVFGAAENNYENLYRGYERSSGFTEDAFDPYVQIYIS